MKKLDTLKLAAALVIAASAARTAEIDPKNGLLEAVRDGNTARVSQLLEHGADPNVMDSQGTPLLMNAVLYGDAKTVRALLAHGADPNAKNAVGATALLWTAGDPKKASALLAYGADPNAQSALGRTPLLSAAAQDGASQVVKYLLEAKANTNVKDNLRGAPNVPNGGGGATPVIEAAKARDGQALRMLLAVGADVNATDANGGTALSEASLLGNLENVQMLLKAGANVNVRSGSWKYTPLFLAVMRNDARIVRLLLDAGAEVNALDSTGSTPLMLAAYVSDNGDTEVVKMLRAAGAAVQSTNTKGETAMTWAKWHGETAVARLLKQWGAADSPAADYAGTPAVAAAYSEPPTIREAVEKGLAVMQPSGPVFTKKFGCASCHNQALPAMVVAMARERGFRFDENTADQQRKAILTVLKPAQELLLEGSDVVPQVPATGGYLLMGLAAQGYAPDEGTAAVVHNIAMRQRPDGSWTGWAPRPPISGRDVRETALAARALDLYAPSGRREEFEGRIAQARQFLLKAKPETPEEAIFRLFGLTWTKADAKAIRAAAAEVLAAQRPDGGWAQLKTRASDAYATGEALMALHNAGALAVESPAYQRGVQYLLKTQEQDGSWMVKTRAFPFQPLIDTGFPHGRDQWISEAGTSWALMALMTAEPANSQPIASIR